MKYFVYILFSNKDKGLYVGQTDNLKLRIEDHNNGKVKSTCYRHPLILIHKEDYSSRKEAMRREQFLKSLYGAKTKEKILKIFYQTARPNHFLMIWIRVRPDPDKNRDGRPFAVAK